MTVAAEAVTVTRYGTRVSPRFVPATVAELQRVGLFASLSGETLMRLADHTERIEISSGGRFGSTDSVTDVLLSGLARGGNGLLRPGDVAEAAAGAVTACIVARIPRAVFDAIVAAP